MNAQSVSLISTFVNLGLGISKVIFGMLAGSMALMADGVHSGLDVFSSFVTFLGLKAAKKPVDEKHPYGHWKAESLAGFFVALLLAISGIWILYEAVQRFFGEELVTLTLGAIIIVILSILITEILARLKFHYGEKDNSLALVADAEHSRADAISSIGVLVGLLLVRYFNLADAIVAIFIGAYILFEAYGVGREITDSLLDVADKETEKRIIKICEAHKMEISKLRTRKIGVFISADLKVKLPPKLKMDEVQKLTETLEERLLKNIPKLKEVTISVEAYEVQRRAVLPKFGKKIGTLQGFEKLGPEKRGKRSIIPLDEKGTKIGSQFGSEKYLVVDIKNNQILTKEIVENPYFKEQPHGARFAKGIRADKALTPQIGDNAKQNLNNFGIEVELTPENRNINRVLNGLKKDEKENQ